MLNCISNMWLLSAQLPIFFKNQPKDPTLLTSKSKKLRFRWQKAGRCQSIINLNVRVWLSFLIFLESILTLTNFTISEWVEFNQVMYTWILTPNEWNMNGKKLSKWNWNGTDCHCCHSTSAALSWRSPGYFLGTSACWMLLFGNTGNGNGFLNWYVVIMSVCKKLNRFKFNRQSLLLKCRTDDWVLQWCL